MGRSVGNSLVYLFSSSGKPTHKINNDVHAPIKQGRERLVAIISVCERIYQIYIIYV